MSHGSGSRHLSVRPGSPDSGADSPRIGAAYSDNAQVTHNPVRYPVYADPNHGYRSPIPAYTPEQGLPVTWNGGHGFRVKEPLPQREVGNAQPPVVHVDARLTPASHGLLQDCPQERRPQSPPERQPPPQQPRPQSLAHHLRCEHHVAHLRAAPSSILSLATRLQAWRSRARL